MIASLLGFADHPLVHLPLMEGISLLRIAGEEIGHAKILDEGEREQQARGNDGWTDGAARRIGSNCERNEDQLIAAEVHPEPPVIHTEHGREQMVDRMQRSRQDKEEEHRDQQTFPQPMRQPLAKEDLHRRPERRCEQEQGMDEQRNRKDPQRMIANHRRHIEESEWAAQERGQGHIQCG